MSLRVVHILSAPAAGGAEVFAKDLAIEQIKEGFSVSFIFLNSAKEIGRSETFEHNFLKELDIKNISYYFLSRKLGFSIFSEILKFNQILKVVSPDILHVHLYWGLLLLLFSFRRYKVLYTHHNVLLRCPRWMYILWNFRVDRFVAISDVCYESLRSVAKKPIDVIKNGINFDRIKLVQYPKVFSSENDFVQLVAVGALSPQKNYPLMLNSLSKIKEKNFRLMIAGEGFLRSELEALVIDLGIEKKVEFLGNIDYVPQLLSVSDVFLMSSDWEGLPISLLEACAAGLPCVVSDVGGCREVVESLSNGFVVDNQNVLEFADAVKCLLVDRSLRESFAESSRARINQYSIENSYLGYLQAYNKTVSLKEIL